MAQSTHLIDQATPTDWTVDFRSVRVSEEEFYALCRDNPELRIEMTAEGELIIMPPTGSETGRRNSTLTQRVANWAEADGTGLSFDSSTGFILPNGAKRSPDASWIKKERWHALAPEQRERFAPICPDFVVELRSPDDRLPVLQAKMVEYIENGARLGLLLDPIQRSVYVYRPNQQPEQIDNPETISGDPVLPGFVLKLKDIW
ncbi:MAG TPA: Uma2 family endonuclease [Blastocatellia bacterium]|nr:Uma2 family endonuclease [Blastocatellia bacterium]